MSQIQKRNTVRVYACGGTGANIGQLLDTYEGVAPLFAQLEVSYIDTSSSNFLEGARVPVAQAARTYIVRDGDNELLDGSGGLRSDNAQAIIRHVAPILQNHKPAGLNVVVSSGGGGSGSVIAPALLQELLLQGENVVAITIGSADTAKRAENTYKTLLTYASISEKLKKPVVVQYFQNPHGDEGIDQINSEAVRSIISLCVLFSGNNKGLDTRDLAHWLDYPKITPFEPGLVSLEVIFKGAALKRTDHILSVATLARPGTSTSLGAVLQAQTVGNPPEVPNKPNGATEPVYEALPVHFVITDGTLPAVVKELKALTHDVRQSATTRQTTRFDFSNEHANDDGLIL